MQRALAIDPLSRLYTIDAAFLQYKLRRYDRALEGIRRAEQLDPDYFLLNLSRALVYQERRDWARALEEFHRGVEKMHGAPGAVAMLAQAEARAGNIEAARRDLAEVKRAAKDTYVPKFLEALAEYAVGDVGEGRASLKQSVNDHCGLLVWFSTTPVFDQIAADPVGRVLLKRVGN